MARERCTYCGAAIGPDAELTDASIDRMIRLRHRHFVQAPVIVDELADHGVDRELAAQRVAEAFATEPTPTERFLQARRDKYVYRMKFAGVMLLVACINIALAMLDGDPSDLIDYLFGGLAWVGAAVVLFVRMWRHRRSEIDWDA